MGDPGLVHVQPEFKTVFEHAPTLFLMASACALVPLTMSTKSSAYRHIGISAISNSGFPLPVFLDCGTSASLDTVIPVPAILSDFPAEVAFMQILIELIQHDVRQQRRYHTTLRYAFTGSPKESDINMSRLDSFPQQGHETCVADPAAYGFHQQTMMYGVEVAGQISFNNPAPRVSPQSVSCNFTVRIAWWTLRSGRKPYESV